MVVQQGGLQFHAGEQAFAAQCGKGGVEEVGLAVLQFAGRQGRAPHQHHLAAKVPRRQQVGLQGLVVRACVEAAARAPVGHQAVGVCGGRGRWADAQVLRESGRKAARAGGHAAHHEVVVRLHTGVAMLGSGITQGLQGKHLGPQRGAGAVHLLAAGGQHHGNAGGHRAAHRLGQGGVLRRVGGGVGKHHVKTNGARAVLAQAVDQAGVQAARKRPALAQLLKAGFVDCQDGHGHAAAPRRGERGPQVKAAELQRMPGAAVRGGPHQQQGQ